MRVYQSRAGWHRAVMAGLAAPLIGSVLAAAGPAAASAAAPRVDRPESVLLIDGTSLNVRTVPGGGHLIAARTAARPEGLISLSVGHRLQEIPADAVPYLGHGLDPSLFDVAGLLRAEHNRVLPVEVFFRGPAHRLPGVTVTKSGTGSEHGYLTAAGAAAFGAALARQFRADHRTGRYGQDGLFASGLDIAVAGAPVRAARPAREAGSAGPAFRLHTLTVAATNVNGRPDTGDGVFVLNADNPARFDDPNEAFNVFDHGTTKFAVPAGHYWAIGDFLSFSGTSGAERLVVLPQFAVLGSRTVRMSERSASSEIGFSTSRPATLQQTSFTLLRGSGNGQTYSFGFTDEGLRLWVSPTSRKPTVGTLRTFSGGQLTSSRDGTNAAYAYNLHYAGPAGIIPAMQHHNVRPADLATVTDRYVQDRHTQAAWGAFGAFPAELQGFLFAIDFPFSAPATQVQYYTANPSLAWQAFYGEYNTLSLFGAGQSDSFRVFTPGQKVAEDWNAYPLHPQPNVQLLNGRLGAVLPAFVSAARSGNTLTLAPNPFSDNTPGHVGQPMFSFISNKALVTGSYAIYQDGKKIAHGNPVNGIAPVPLSSHPAQIRFVLSEARGPDAKFPLSPAATTTWTWRSAAKAHAKVPADWFCGFTSRGELLRNCSVQPMMTLNYLVNGLPPNGRAPAGSQQIALTVGHIQLAQAAPITGATAQVSYNDGQSFQPATVTPTGGGRFLIGFRAPAGVDVTLRVSATDAAGGSITETIQRAYGVAP